MNKVAEIESALSRINGDIFQEFCNHFLYLKLNPNSITPIGSVVGKEKSRKGIPDCYFTSANNELVFAEYTTRERLKTGESFYNKLKSDIENCFDNSKTGLKNEDIGKVILCFTERIKPDEKKKLEELCKKYNPKSILDLKGIRDLAFGVLDYPILGSYIDIQIGTGQIQEPSEFIAKYEKNKLSTPLSNSFWGRDKEIEDGLNFLNNSDVLLIHGAPGTGKSKYAIEIAKLYSDKNDFTFLCIGNKGIPIWDDLKSIVRFDKKYLLLVDDANRLTKNFQWILSLLEDRESSSLKIIATVRDYAFSQVKSIANNYHYSTIEIKTFSNDEISKIIRSDDFKINEPSYIDRILKIAQGNARLAIMCLRATNIMELYDVSQIYDEYFEPLFGEVKLLKDPVALKTLAIISFFSHVDKNNREICDFIFDNIDLDESQFWEICYSLHESELVDLFEQQVVKISDQIFATYIFYKAVVEKEILNFSFFIANYLQYENRITDTIVPLINTFNYKHIESKLKPIIFSKWHDIEKLGSQKDSLKYLDLFWFYLSPQVITFLKKQIEKQGRDTSTEYRYTYESNEFSYNVEQDLEILSRFRYHEDELFKDALELMFYYSTRIPSKMPAVIYIIKEKFCFARLGYANGYRVQHLLFDFLIENAQISPDREIYANVLLEILPKFLQIEFREHEGNGRSITIYTFHLWLSKSIQSFRAKCFNYLIANAKKSLILQVLYRLNFYEYKNSEEILQHDLNFIFPIINKFFNPDEFEDCFVLQYVLEGLNWLGVDYSKKIRKEYNSSLFQLAEVLKPDKQRKRELGWDEEEKLHQKELLEYCRDFDIDKYASLFMNVALLLKQVKNIGRNNIEWQYINSMNTILGNLAKTDKNLFLKVLELTFKNFKFNLDFTYIFNHFFQSTPQYYKELFDAIKHSGENIRFSFHQTLNIDSVKDEHIPLLYTDILTSIKSLTSPYNFWDLTFVSKYKKLKQEREIYFEILEIVLAKIKIENVKISVGENFIEKCTTFDNFSFDILVEAYLYTNNIEQHFDHKKEILKTLILRDPNVIIRFLKFNYPHKISYHDLELEHFDFIWTLENYTEIIDSIFEYFLATEKIYFSEEGIAAFFPQINDKYGDRPTDYLRFLIDGKYSNNKYMDAVFSIVCNKYPNLKMEFLERFLKLNSDVEDFKNLEITHRSHSWSGSYIPILEGEQNIWKAVLSVIDKLPERLKYTEHKEHVNRQIGYCEIRIKEEMKREFYEER